MKKEPEELAESDQHLLILLISIQEKYQYSTAQKTVSHYLQRIYPAISELDQQEILFYNKVKTKLEDLLKGRTNSL